MDLRNTNEMMVFGLSVDFVCLLLHIRSQKDYKWCSRGRAMRFTGVESGVPGVAEDIPHVAQ